jgi:hypothetical protein
VTADAGISKLGDVLEQALAGLVAHERWPVLNTVPWEKFSAQERALINARDGQICVYCWISKFPLQPAHVDNV